MDDGLPLLGIGLLGGLVGFLGAVLSYWGRGVSLALHGLCSWELSLSIVEIVWRGALPLVGGTMLRSFGWLLWVGPVGQWLVACLLDLGVVIP